ncbi:hypothetical protein ACOMHN_004028 [Nucella lapillus]
MFSLPSFGLVTTTMMTMSMLPVDVTAHPTNQTEAAEFLQMFDTQMQSAYTNMADRYWTDDTNITVENQLAAVNSDLEFALWRQNMSRLAAQYHTANFTASMQRQFVKIKDIGTDALDDPDKLKELKSTVAQIAAIYSTAKVLENNRRLPLDPGNMWAHEWNSIQDLLMPYPDKAILDVTPQMVQQNYTARKIFETADDFFTSLGLKPMPQPFWDKSMLEKPQDGREVVCHASTWDFLNGIDFRVKQCTAVTMEHFSTAHHEMGHVEYYLLYKRLPVVFREGANPVRFHEAVGDTISLSVQTPKHLHQIGLLPSLVDDRESELNFLMSMALQKIAFLPFGYLIDQWRWSVFRGNTTSRNYNQGWWDLRCNLQGVSPPVKRTEEDFDPGAKFHIPNNTPYIRYFVSFVIQFQFQKALCDAAGHQGPLHTCDIYNSTAAGDKLRAMLSKGSSEVWTVPFQALTGLTNMSAQPLIQYFKPLMTYLQNANKDEHVGWTEGCPPPPMTPPETDSSARHVSFTFLMLTLVTLVTVLF